MVCDHLTTTHALEAAARENCCVACADVSPDSKDKRQVHWDALGEKLLVVMGNEQRGVSNKVKALADETQALPNPSI